MFVNHRARFLEELLGLQEEILTVNDELFDAESGTVKASKSRIRNLNGLLSDLHAVQERTASKLKSLGVSLALVGDSHGERYIPLATSDGAPVEAAQPPQQEEPSKWRQYAAYAVAGGLIAAGIFGAWVFFVPFKGSKPQNLTYGPLAPPSLTNDTPSYNQTSEIPQTQQNQTPANQTPIVPPVQQNQTQINQTPNQTLEDTIDTPDYLKYLSGKFTRDTFVGLYGIADAEHNPDGNYTLRVRDSNNRTILETDLNDSETDDERFWFSTNDFKQNIEYSVEILRNGTLAHEPLKFTIPNSPPEVMISADARFGNDNQRLVEYTLRVSDDRQVEGAEISLINASGGKVIQLKKFDVNKQGLRLDGLLLVDSGVPAGKYHVLAKARDNEGSYSEAVIDVDLPELPIPPPPPPPQPHVNVPPQIVGVAWAYDKDRDKFVADVDVNDPDGPNLSLEQKLLDNGSNVNAPMASQVSGSRIHSEVGAQGLDSVYDWNLTVKDGANGTATQMLKNVWAWMRGLAGYWKFDGNGTDYVKGNNASLQNGADFAQGKRGQALSLDGIDDFANIPNNPDYSRNDFSVSMWVNAKELQGKNYRALLKKGDYNPQGWTIMTGEGNNSDRIFVIGWDGGSWKDLGVTPALQTDKFYALGFVYDGAHGKAYTYLDGVLVNETNVSGSLVQNSEPMKVGHAYEAAGVQNPGFWNGLIDDIRFYSKALTDKEVAAIAEDQ